MENKGNSGKSAPTETAAKVKADGSQKAEAEASRAEAFRTCIARLQRRAHELHVDCTHGAKDDALPSDLNKRVHQLKNDVEILLMLVEG